MAKKSMIAREERRLKMERQLRKKRQAIRQALRDRTLDFEERVRAMYTLQQLPRDSSASRQQRRCRISGRPHAVYRKFGLGRNMLREAVMRGDVPGVLKASW